MPLKDAHLYGIRRPAKNSSPASVNPSTSAFSNALSSLISASPSTTNARNRPATSKSTERKSDIFTAHKHDKSNKRSATSMLGGEQKHSTQSDRIDEAAWKRAKRKMDDKARLYAALKRGDVADDSEKYGVDFDRKWAEREDAGAHSAPSSSDEDSDESDQEIIEYQDEFGRTRKVTRKEMAREEARRRREARYNVEAENDSMRPMAPANVIYGDAIQHEAFNPDETRAEHMRELAAKRDKSATPPPDVHYDADAEIRNRGTGFYKFSTAEEERLKEMEDLAEERKATEQAREEVKERKEKELSERERKIAERRRLIQEKRSQVQTEQFLAKFSAEMAAQNPEKE